MKQYDGRCVENDILYYYCAKNNFCSYFVHLLTFRGNHFCKIFELLKSFSGAKRLTSKYILHKILSTNKWIKSKGNSNTLNSWKVCVSYLRLGKHYVRSVRIRSCSGPHFPEFGLNTERYGVSFHIQSKCRKMRTRITPNTDTFYVVKVSWVI